MPSDTHENQDSKTGSYLWIAGAVGAAAGIAALVYSRRRETPWEKTRRRTLEIAEAARDAAETARKQAKPWMGVAAGAAVTGAGLAYKMRSKPTGLNLAQRRAAKIAERCNDAVQPWMIWPLRALSAVTLARSRNKQSSAANPMSENASAAASKLAEKGARLFRRVQQITGETRKLYPSVKRLIA